MRWTAAGPAALAAVAAALCLAAPATAAAAQPFARDAWPNARLPHDAPIDPRSRAYVRHLTALVGARGVRTNVEAWSTTVYTVARDQRNVRVRSHAGNPWVRRQLGRQWDAVPIPPGARAAAGVDGHMVIHQPATDTMWEFFQARRDRRGRWSAGFGGRIERLSANPGHFEAPPLGIGRLFGATGTSIPLLAGLIRGDELRAGRIPHAVAFACACKRRAWRWPAQRTDGFAHDRARGVHPAGTLFRLPARLDVEALDAPERTKMLARAIQRHGMVHRDYADAGIAFYAEDPLTGGAYARDGLSYPGFPWGALQAVHPSHRPGR
jgi:hypothetical protein